MPDNKKQGRTSNKAMTFFVCFLAALAGLLFGRAQALASKIT